ncbi:MAG: 50S ribosomal protein L11 methyltransferase [Deltaproteobacteria bacterium]|jgi:ribosomal protein L11 methyltransferase|nr:50S ribosomal protein L11 methyltransferase [Deltaproteobacteria bacterium]MBW2573021.1 50S ribosomal protein L11 methyltransferase [Deltaproteobacteria bacterium]
MSVSEKTEKSAVVDRHAIRREVLSCVNASKKKLTPGELEKALSGRFSMDHKDFKTVIRSLVSDRELIYTYHFGCSFLEKSFNKPTRISHRVVLKPHGMFYQPASQDVVINIPQGAAFGSGDHPTTRLAVRGIENALFETDCLKKEKDTRALDIGTGSGVLAIAAVSLGIKTAKGIDIDPCARTEARKNIQLNNLEHRIAIHDHNIQDIHEKFTLIAANLRYPTLKQLCSHMAQITEEGGAIVVSGIKTDEVSDLLNEFTQNRFRCVWKTFEKDWAGMVFVR